MADREAPKKTVRKPAKKTAARPSARKPAAPRSRYADPPIDQPIDQQIDDEADETTPDEPAGYRPVAVMGAPASAGLDEAEAPASDDAVFAEPPPEPAVPSVDEIEHPMREVGVGVLSALLAALTFMPWYRSGPLESSGWASGTWGPVVFALGLGGVLIVALRRFNVPVLFPVHHAVVLEGMGWAAVGLVLLKRFMAPTVGLSKMDDTGWLLAAIVVSLALALLGGSVSHAVSMVVRPGWFNTSAGKLGAGVLAVCLAIGAAFGVLNDVSTGLPSAERTAPVLKPGYPECASNAGVPLPTGVIAGTGSAAEGFCLATLTSDLGAARAVRAYVTALKSAGFRIVYDSRKDSELAQNVYGQLQAQRGSDCTSITVQKNPAGGKGSSITVVVGPPSLACNLKDKIKSLRESP